MIKQEEQSAKKDITRPETIFAIERTHAAWVNMSIWAFTIGMLAMNSNQALATTTLNIRLQSPVFINGLLLAFIGVLSIPYHLYIYEKRVRLFEGNELYGNRRGIYVLSILLSIVMISALVGSAIYGAIEVVEVS